MKRICVIAFLILLLLLAAGCRKQPKISRQSEPVQSAAESQQEVQTELPAPAARTWQDIQALLPDVSAMSDFPTAEEAWRPEPIVVHCEGAEYWIDQSESWESSKICMRKDGQTTCIYAAQDGSLSQLAVFDGMLYFAQTGGIYRMPTESGAAELWIPDGGRFVLTGGVIYTWLPEQKFCAIAAQDPKQAVPVWAPTQALACKRSVPVTGGIVLWLTENKWGYIMGLINNV